ncbi:thiolase family protein [Bradyrhizobium sp. AUGA SZCCT0182]|uniref:thiolase family protein n=1 Tax=Bradyrhizobium sp. AUGA SZCCT0182 TaxID=2807667 RepID=UPI001BADA3EE|nr:thiolase family protein [Bradyrhizobium sp. AUGA SZCCT0182]MBR1237000.1 thiolase family protein [Bradyrhizobium sp. AUGA SZCCT0182]
MGTNLSGKAVIAGIGATRFGALPGRTTISMNVEAIRKALNDTGIEKDAVDALYVKCPTSKFEMMYGQKIAEAIGLQPRIGGVWDSGGSSNVIMISQAIMAIEAGQCEVAVVTFADNPKTGSAASYNQPRGEDALYGWFAVLSSYAMIARRHMGEFGTPREALGAVAVAARRHGAQNPNAQLRKPLALDDYMNLPPMVAPFCRDDCTLVSDGAAAVVVMSAERARKMGVAKPVPVLGFGFGQTSWDVTQRPDMTSTQAKVAGETALRMAGLKPKDMDVAQIYDCFTITALMTLEDYGFAKKGQIADFVKGGNIEIGGELPMNTSGGLLSETGMPGMQLIHEGVRQMRGDASLQVKGAKHCIISNQGGVMHTHAALILGQ